MIQELAPGKIYLENGPTQMVIEAKHHEQPMRKEVVEAANMVPSLLESLVEVLPLAKQPWPSITKLKGLPEVLRRMLISVSATNDKTLTPMAAVAGAFADIVADNLFSNGATKVIVNNGGDIALRQKSGESTEVGISPRSGGAKPTHYIHIDAENGIGGVTTSGLGGRSFTLGIADAVVALGKDASFADACSTLIANHTDVACSNIIREPAQRVFRDTDIAGMWVTTHVKDLPDWAVDEALSRGLKKTEALVKDDVILGAIIYLAGRMKFWPENMNLISFQAG